MASKVEELHHQLLDRISKFVENKLNPFTRDEGKYVSWLIIDSLISAARSEGVAEGTEQERERIRFYSEVIYNTHLGVTAVKQWIVPDNILDPSVLAPTKEVAG